MGDTLKSTTDGAQRAKSLGTIDISNQEDQIKLFAGMKADFATAIDIFITKFFDQLSPFMEGGGIYDKDLVETLAGVLFQYNTAIGNYFGSKFDTSHIAPSSQITEFCGLATDQETWITMIPSGAITVSVPFYVKLKGVQQSHIPLYAIFNYTLGKSSVSMSVSNTYSIMYQYAEHKSVYEYAQPAIEAQKTNDWMDKNKEHYMRDYLNFSRYDDDAGHNIWPFQDVVINNLLDIDYFANLSFDCNKSRRHGLNVLKNYGFGTDTSKYRMYKTDYTMNPDHNNKWRVVSSTSAYFWVPYNAVSSFTDMTSDGFNIADGKKDSYSYAVLGNKVTEYDMKMTCIGDNGTFDWQRDFVILDKYRNGTTEVYASLPNMEDNRVDWWKVFCNWMGADPNDPLSIAGQSFFIICRIILLL